MNDPDLGGPAERLSILLHEVAPEFAAAIAIEDIARRVPGRRAHASAAPVTIAALVSVIAVVIAVSTGVFSQPRGSGGLSAAPPSPTPIATRAGNSATTSSTPLPKVVDGVPLAELARRAFSASSTWSEPRPTHARVVVTRTQYIVELQGHFRCAGGCLVAIPFIPSGTATPTNSDEGSLFIRMILTTPLPGNAGKNASSGLRVDRRSLNINKLGHPINLQPYIDALE